MRIKLSLVDDNNEQIDYTSISLQKLRYKDLESVIIDNLWLILQNNLTVLENHLMLVETFNEDKKR